MHYTQQLNTLGVNFILLANPYTDLNKPPDLIHFFSIRNIWKNYIKIEKEYDSNFIDSSNGERPNINNRAEHNTDKHRIGTSHLLETKSNSSVSFKTVDYFGNEYANAPCQIEQEIS